MKQTCAALALLLTPVLAFADNWSLASEGDAFQRVTDRADFVSLMSQGSLSRLGMTVVVEPDGDITGRAFGRKVSGNWDWENGYFCRDLYWGKMDLGPNCQEVTVAGRYVRFTSDQGTGQSADLLLK